MREHRETFLHLIRKWNLWFWVLEMKFWLTEKSTSKVSSQGMYEILCSSLFCSCGHILGIHKMCLWPYPLMCDLVFFTRLFSNYAWFWNSTADVWWITEYASVMYTNYFSLLMLCSCIDLPTISSCIYSFDLWNRLRAFLVACPPRSLSPPVAELVIATAGFQQDLSLWNIKWVICLVLICVFNYLLYPYSCKTIFSPVKGGVDAKELFHSHITMWIQDKRRHLLDQCKLDKVYISIYS